MDNTENLSNAGAQQGEPTPTQAVTNGNVTVITEGDTTYHIVGTAHVSESSRREVESLIQSLHPDKVCVELCRERYDSLHDADRWRKLDIFNVIRRGRFLYLLATLALSSYQRKMGDKLGVRPGAELIGAAEAAENNNIEVVLIDRNINTTLKRTWANLGFLTKCKMLGALMSIMFESSDDSSKEDIEKEIEELKRQANLSSVMDTVAQQIPEMHTPLIDERDRYLAAKMRSCGGQNVLAVVGAGHVAGIKKYFSTKIDTDELDKLPKPSIAWTIVKWLIPAILVAGIAIGVSQQGFDSLRDLLTAWILPNSFFCLITAILSMAHPLTILASIFVSPITSTTPVIGAGIVLGLLEAWLRKPTVADCENVPNVSSIKELYRNRFTHVLVVAMLTTFGSALGAWVGIGWLLTILGVG